MRSFFIVLALGLVSLTSFAQEPLIFGDEQQPGNRLHTEIVSKISAGQVASEAINESIQVALSEESTVLTPDSKSAMSLNVVLSSDFFAQMIESNSLIEVTKVLIEEYPDAAGQIVSLGTYLYPDFAQEVINGAALTGIISADDALIVALSAGADPTVVSVATAAGAAPAPTAPVGTGLGGGGTGGGDTTASTN